MVSDEMMHHPEVRVVTPGSQLPVDGTVLHDVGPRSSEWLPELLEQLLPATVRTVRERVAACEPRTLAGNRSLTARDHGHAETADLFGLLDDELLDPDAPATAATAAAIDYHHAATEYALKYHDVDEGDLADFPDQYREQHTLLVETLTKIGTGRGDWNGGLDALEKGPVALFDYADEPPVVSLFLDAEAWLDVDDSRTAEHALDVISTLADALDIRLVLSSPRLASYLTSTHEEWCEDVVGLTERRDSSGVPVPVSDDTPDGDRRQRAWDALEDIASSEGRVRLLTNLSPDEPREVRDLKQDNEIGLTDGTVGRYIGDLEALDLVEVDRSGRYNAVTLSALGEAALEFVADDYSLVHPDQASLRDVGTRLTPTPHRDASTVYRADQSTGTPYGGPSTAEEWLAATGDPDDGASYVQWLSGPSDCLDAWAMHDRLRAGRRAEGVTLVDDPIEEFEDGRVAYISCFDDDLQVVTQWGRSLPTLARVTAALLSDRAMSKILTPSAVGREFDEVFEGEFEAAVEDVFQRGAQIGWFSEDELYYDNFRERFGNIRTKLLAKLAEVAGTTDYEQRQGLYRDLHGLLASATHLYRAVGIDVTVHVRVPDTTTLRRDERRYDDFLGFFRYTVPKNAAYGVHSVYRHLLEDRPEKLRSRLSMEVSPDEPTADLTASWVVTGPDATSMKMDLRRAVQREAEDVREAIREGTEDGVALEVPVVEGNTFAQHKQLVERYLERKGYQRGWDYKDLTATVRLLMAVLSDERRGASPFDVAEALLALAKKKAGTDLSLSDIAYGLGELPASRLFPSLVESQRKMLKALLQADTLMGRAELIDAAGISKSSYQRHWEELAAFDVVERTDEKEWTVYLVPWWATTTDRTRPYEADEEDPRGGFEQRWPDVIGEAIYTLDDVQEPAALGAYPPDFHTVLAKADLTHWRPYLKWLTDIGDPELDTIGTVRGPRKREPKPDIVMIGRRPPGAGSQQRSLDCVGEEVA